MEKLLAYIKTEWGVLSKAPSAFIGLALLCGFVGGAAATWYYSGQVATLREQLNERESRISRYRVALGIDPASKGALIELDNKEIQAKAISTASNLREFCFSLRKRTDEIQAQLNAGKIDKKAHGERWLAINREMSDYFARNLRSDAFNVDNELRRRLGPRAVAAIVGITPSIVANDGTRIDLLTVLPGGSVFDASFTCTLAHGIEQMAKLLPLDSQTR